MKYKLNADDDENTSRNIFHAIFFLNNTLTYLMNLIYYKNNKINQ